MRAVPAGPNSLPQLPEPSADIPKTLVFTSTGRDLNPHDPFGSGGFKGEPKSTESADESENL